MTRSEALALVHAYLQPQRQTLLAEGDDLVVNEPATIERPWGWVFFYTSRLWLKTGEIRYALAGNAPLLVERETGKIHVTGSARPIETYVVAFERSGNPHAGIEE